MKPKEIVYPDLDAMCRLCLRENIATISIFDKALSLPIRIMSCAALEVQSNDGLPSNVCKDCRVQLEKSYYFRKRCQLSESKLRKHLRLVNAGKPSKVFVNLNEEDDDDEVEFEDSINFLRTVDETNEEKKNEDREKWEQACREQIRLEEKQKCECKLLEEEELLRKTIKMEEAKKIESIRSKAFDEIKQIRSNLQATLKAERAKFEEEIANAYRNKETENLLHELNQFIIKKRQSLEQQKLNSSEISPCQTNELISKDSNIEISENPVDVAEKLPEHYVIYNADGFSDNELGDFQFYEKNDKNSTQTEDDQKSDDYNIEGVNQYIVCNDDFDILETDQKQNCGEEINENEEEESDEMYQDEENDDPSPKSEYIEINELMYANDYQGVPLEDELELPLHEKKDESYFDKQEKLATPNEESNRRVVSIEMVGNTRIAIEKSLRMDDLKTFRCTECAQSFTKKANLERHISAHEKSNGFSCHHCSKWFTCKSSLDRHARTHTGEKPFKCDVCSKSFMQKEVLKRHTIMHTGVRPFPCKQCDKSFLQKKLLSLHVNKFHLNCPIVELNNCHLCPKKFFHSSGLSRHLQQHTGIIFTCGQCSKSFNDKSALKRHVLALHENRSKKKLKN